VKIDWKKEVKLKRPKARGGLPSIKLPRPVTDLYADLRDRHLLPLVALLIVAIVAAPILLGSSGGKKQPPVAVAPSSAGGETNDSSFTVVPAARGLASPAKRLGHRHALDPFRIDAGAAPETETSSGSTSSSGGETSSPESSSGEGSAGASSESTGSGSGAAESTGAESSPATHPESTTTTTENVTVQHEVVGYTVDLEAGAPGELTEQTEVEQMTKLPSAKNPVVLFVGLSQDDKRALFLMTSKVTAYYGSVKCAVDKQACQMVELKPGHSASFGYGYGENESRYKVVLKKIEPVVRSHEDAAQETVKETRREHPKARGSSVGLAVVAPTR
jgi:hypothetical protein